MTTISRRKRRQPGQCEDCGRGPVRTIRFWLNGMAYRVCADHEREYCRGGRATVERTPGTYVKQGITHIVTADTYGR